MLMNTAEYLSIIENIKSEITAAQYRATVHVNADMLLLYYDIGCVINEHKSWGNKFIDNLAIFSLLANVADVKSLVIHPATTTHSQCTEEELLDQGIKPNTIRLSIGIEKVEDLIAALDAAFEAVK